MRRHTGNSTGVAKSLLLGRSGVRTNLVGTNETMKGGYGLEHAEAPREEQDY